MAFEASLQERVSVACEQLKAAFPGQVITEDHPEYEVEVCQNWSVTSRIPATAYARLDTVQQVAKAISIVKRTETKFAIRSAGHNANPGFSSLDVDGKSGIVLDLRGLKSKVLDRNANIASMGAGNNWLETFSWLEGENLSAIGSREGRVGLSGFLLGGGQGILSSLYGLGVDGVKSFEVVLADGTIVNANAESHPDLYFALKGGGSNFGIVTAVSLDIHPLIKLQYGINMYDASDYENVLHAFAQVQKSMEQDSRIGMFVNGRKDFIAVGLFYADWPVEIPTAFEPIVKLPSLVAAAVPTSNGTFSTLSEILEKWAYKDNGLKHAYLTMTTRISHELYVEGHQCYKEIVAHLPDSVSLHWSIQPLTQAAVAAGKDRGGNILGLENVSQSCWIFTCDWKEDENDEVIKTALHKLLQRVEKLADDKGLLLDLRFPTFAGASQNVLASFGAENVKKLRDTAARYDPSGVFQKLQCGGFLLRCM